jgi:chromosome segregation ATPase
MLQWRRAYLALRAENAHLDGLAAQLHEERRRAEELEARLVAQQRELEARKRQLLRARSHIARLDEHSHSQALLEHKLRDLLDGFDESMLHSCGDARGERSSQSVDMAALLAER